MNAATNKKYELLDAFVDAHYKKWRTKFSNNMVGVHVGRKAVDGKQGTRLSIVFHVVVKHDIEKRHLIPKYYEVKVMGRKNPMRVPTDVIETGKLQLQTSGAYCGATVQEMANWARGSLGFFARRNGHLYFCSNAHVIGYGHLKKGFQRFEPGTPGTEVGVYTDEGRLTGALEEMIFDDSDIAIARIDGMRHVNRTPEWPIGPYVLEVGPWVKNRSVKIYGANTKGHTGRVENYNVRKTVSKKGVEVDLTSLLRIQPLVNGPTQEGDSGAPIVLDGNELLAILVAAEPDGSFIYGIPIQRIVTLLGITPL